MEAPKYYIAFLTSGASRNLVSYYNRVLAPMGLTAQQAMALGVLYQEPDLSLGVVAQRLGIGKAAAVTMIKRLETMGYVTREEHPRDGRLNRINLTEKAMGMAPDVVKKVQALERTVEKAVGLDNLKTLIETLTVIRDLDLKP